MCNSNHNLTNQLDEQRMLYVYQGLNVVMKLLSQHLDRQTNQDGYYEPSLAEAYQKADAGSIIGMAAMAMKNGKITQQQYDEIFEIAMDIKTVHTTAKSEPNWNEQYLAANKFLNQYRR